MKPFIICHMLSPLDGRLLVDAWAPSGSPLYKDVLAEYGRLHDAFEADAWMAGTETMKEFATGKAAPQDTGAAPERPWHQGDASARRFAIALDRKASLHWDSPTADRAHVVVVLGSEAPDSHLRELVAAGVSYLVMPGADIDPAEALEALNQRLGIRKILLEGGAHLNGALLQAGLVDEISLLLCPAIDGSSGSPAIFEAGEKGLGQGVGPGLRLELLSADVGAAGTCHLRYRVGHPT